MYEGWNPGAIVPGVVGAICLLLAAYALQVLPVNYAGLALIIVGIALMVAEAYAPELSVRLDWAALPRSYSVQSSCSIAVFPDSVSRMPSS